MTSAQVRRRRLRTLSLAASAVLVAALVPTLLTGTADAAAAFTSTVVNQGNGNCVDVPGGASTSGLQLIQWSCNGGGNQSFTFSPVSGSSDAYTLGVVANGNCVDISGASSGDGAAVIQYACHGGTNQQFRLQAVATNAFQVVSVSSGKCIAPTGDASASNTALVQVACTSATSREWRLPGYPGGGPGPTPTSGPTGGQPVPGAIRVFWLRPTDVAVDQRYPDGIAAVMAEAQRFFKQQLGKTFKLNSPVVVAVAGDHDTNWYVNNNCTPGGDRYWCVVYNMQAELMRKYHLQDPAQGGVIVGEVSAEEAGKSGGGGGGGWVLLSGHDADGAAGRGGDMNRWYGGMVHELGHAFGLPDSSSTDGTCMSASLYSYPNCVFSQDQKNGILNGPYAGTLS